MGKRCAESDALLLAAGELPGPGIRFPGKADPIEQLERPRLASLALDALRRAA